MKRLLCLLTTISLGTSLLAQEKWDLRRCVEYAIANNISVKQNEIQERLNELVYRQSLDSRWPTLNFSTSLGEQFGRSIDPTTNLFTQNNITFSNLNLQSGVTLFNFFSIKNSINANRLTTEASRAQTKKIQDDIALNVAAAYLQALLSNEQKRTAEVQAAQTMEQLDVTRKRVDAGALPELNAAELEAQLARDSAAVIAAESTYRLNLLQLKALLNLDAGYPFDISTPNIESIPVVPLAELAPDQVYATAVLVRPQQQANQLRYEAAGKNAQAARASMYPTLAAFGNVQSAFSSALSQLPKGSNISTVIQTNSFVNVAGNQFFVNTPISRPESTVPANYWRQLDYNFRQGLGVSLQVPIFNGSQARTAYKRALVNQESVRLQMRADSLTLKQDIYTAYQNAVNALATYNSRSKAYRTAAYSYNLGKQRYDVGLLPVLELITLQNNMQRALIDQIIARYDFVFRTKILEFYRGTGMVL
ncbi:MAG: TolC family protein [Chitinophagaceae bacterium]|jgi:outer membrane protein|nr:TolC family protein [Chitinophagaceae bacterium]